jgi:low affinity Fe/Cu permease
LVLACIKIGKSIIASFLTVLLQNVRYIDFFSQASKNGEHLMNNCKKHNMELKEKKQKIQVDNLIMGKKARVSESIQKNKMPETPQNS